MNENDSIKFTENEQNALTIVCQTVASVVYRLRQSKGYFSSNSRDELENCLTQIAENFPSVNWGDLYDRFHRQGVNR